MVPDINGAVAANGSKAADIDTNLYSRQLGAYGAEAMGRLIQMNVLICGLKGTGAETAKNLVLAGPRRVALHDDRIVELRDLGANFFLKEEHVGKVTLGEACEMPLAELNNYVVVDRVTGKLSANVIQQYDAVVCTDLSLKESMEISEVCRTRSPPVAFVTANSLGLVGTVFVDFGNEFVVRDQDGNEPQSVIVSGITYENPPTVHVHNDKILPFQDGDYVTFREVQGMEQLNGAGPFKIKVTGKFSFILEGVDVTKFSPYMREGIVTQVKMPKQLKFAPFSLALQRPLPEDVPSLVTADFAKFGRSEQLHFAMHATLLFRDTHGRFPKPRDASDLAEVLKTSEELLKAAKGHTEPTDGVHGKWVAVPVDSIDKEVVENTANFAGCCLNPMAAFLGGIVAQEVVKLTGKFTPLRQWFYFDAFEVLDHPLKDAKPEEFVPAGSRYDDLVCIMGRTFQQRLMDMKFWLVGAGALGCEFLKNFALMGVGCGPKGKITACDMDSIEISNLNRQFLFRREHVGQLKADVATAAAKVMNPALKIHSLQTRVGAESEEVYDDDFWGSLDMVVNALDNVPSRLYVDSKCVWYQKPLMESGTLGTRGNVQVVLPRMTQSYGDSQDPPEESIPLCTLKHFPNQIEHTIEWSRDAFQGLFTEGPQEALAFLQDPEGFLRRLQSEGTSSTQRERLEKIQSLLEMLVACRGMEGCVEKAIRLFEEYFDHQIAQLLYNFPLDHVTTEGVPFWSGPKRAPTPLRYSPDDVVHLEFVKAAANLLAFILGVPQTRDAKEIYHLAKKVPAVEFKPRDVRIKVDENDTTVEGRGDDESVIRTVSDRIVKIAANLGKAKLQAVEFEKDDDTNFHIDFIAACANLRARNYKIAEVDNFKVKLIAGKIIPAIATTTAMVTGLVGFEILKVVDYTSRKLENFKNAFVTLALPMWIMSEPMPPVKTVDKDYDVVVGGPVRARPSGFTPWDKIELRIPNSTVGQLVDKLQEEYGVETCILSVGSFCLYNSFMAKTREQKLKTPILDVISAKVKIPPKRNYVIVEASCSDVNDGVDVVLPAIKLVFK